MNAIIRRALIPLAVGIGIGVFVAGFLAYFTFTKGPVYWVDGLNRPLDTAPWLARLVFGAEKEWAGWSWFFLDMLWFWGGMGLAVFLGSLAGNRSAVSALPKPLYYSRYSYNTQHSIFNAASNQGGSCSRARSWHRI